MSGDGDAWRRVSRWTPAAGDRPPGPGWGPAAVTPPPRSGEVVAVDVGCPHGVPQRLAEGARPVVPVPARPSGGGPGLGGPVLFRRGRGGGVVGLVVLGPVLLGYRHVLSHRSRLLASPGYPEEGPYPTRPPTTAVAGVPAGRLGASWAGRCRRLRVTRLVRHPPL